MVNQERRSFLRFAIHSLGALFGAVLGIPAACYLIDARNRPAVQRDFRPVQGVRLDDLQKDVPTQGVIRDVRTDAWTLHPDDVVGRVWVVKTGNDDASIRVLATICPHLGCFVNNNPPGSGPGFTCPCHSAKFNIDGSKNTGPQQRGMDTLEWKRDQQDRNLLLVKFENFVQGQSEKVPRT
ncbi:MAG: Rieske 2Fe-2S domain-containing protein [Planctomycetes bacterium]|nr:Rieske 2Fe-2S domain-containing protein [Planctomycetota bacterium]